MSRFLTLTLSAFLATSLVPALADSEGHSEKPWSQADDVWGEAEMAPSRHAVQHHHGASRFLTFRADRLEVSSASEGESFAWEADAWYGGDIHKLWVKTEGEYAFEDDVLEEANIQLLWSRAISPFFDLQAGLRQDIEPDGKTYAVLGTQGLAPYLFEVDGAFFLSDEGDLSAEIETEYELAMTQRLHLVPRAALEWSAEGDAAHQTGSGFTHGTLGLRLSYDVIREFSPYIGVEWSGALGDTKDLLHAAGEESERSTVLFGFRGWY